MMYLRKFLIILTLCICNYLYAQVRVVDTSGNKKIVSVIDTSKSLNKKLVFSTRKATIRSAILPGWGQIYNKQIWKLPLVYGALGTTAGIFMVNLREYRGLRDAYKLKVDNIPSNDDQIPERYRVLSANSMKFYRDEYRRNVDYSVLAFVIAWGLNVIDATVSANLKQFNVNDDLSMHIKPMLSAYGQMGVSLVINLDNKQKGPKVFK